MPKWVAWFGGAITVPTWLWITYRTFFTDVGRTDPGVGGWAVLTVVIAVVLAVLILMAARKLPAHLIIEENGDP
ncbi:MAG: hypothetical protein HY704_09730 [Gemmatimonadetes bacterium]|nr:hypothetical protein [Gemmatimonadota bacterium]